MEEIKDSLNIALEIINTLLQEIKKSENAELYQQYVGNDEVESLCDMIAEKMGFNIYRLDNTLNLCVMLDNKVFGYSNEDLKKKIKILNKNEDIYLMYFIIICVLGLLKMLPLKMMFLAILLLLSICYYMVRIYLENDAMLKAKYLAKEYMEEQKISTRDEITEMVEEFDKINNIGIKCVNYNFFLNIMIKVIIFTVICIIR